MCSLLFLLHASTMLGGDLADLYLADVYRLVHTEEAVFVAGLQLDFALVQDPDNLVISDGLHKVIVHTRLQCLCLVVLVSEGRAAANVRHVCGGQEKAALDKFSDQPYQGRTVHFGHIIVDEHRLVHLDLAV